MSLPIQFHSEALLEFKDGAGFYGERFVAQVADALLLIAELPRAWPRWPGRPDLYRRVLTKIPYAVRQDSIQIVAVEHAKRRPGYWLSRT